MPQIPSAMSSVRQCKRQKSGQERRVYPLRSCPVLSGPFVSWVTVWVEGKTLKYRVTISPHKQKKFLISQEIRNFLVETAGLEPVTSCV